MAGQPRKKRDLARLKKSDEDVLELVEKGVPIEVICKETGISKKAFNEHFSGAGGPAFARARARAADSLAVETLGIADRESGDVQRDRLRVDVRKWLAGKWAPEVYSERLGPNVQVNLGTLHLDALRSVNALKSPDTDDIPITLESDKTP